MRRHRARRALAAVIVLASTAIVVGVGAEPAPARASDPAPSRPRIVERAGGVTVVATGRPPAHVRQPAQARLMAERAAVVAAYGAAARWLSSASGAEPVLLRGMRIVSTERSPDGSVTVEMEFSALRE